MSNGNDWSSDTNGNKKSEKSLPSVTVSAIETIRIDFTKGKNIAWTCTSGVEKCNTLIPEAIQKIEDASTSSVLTTAEKAAQRAILNRLGKRGDPGVDIGFSDDIRGLGVTDRNTDGTDKITINNVLRNVDSAASVLDHEGRHAVDDKYRGRDIQTLHERTQTELNAYTNQAAFDRAAGIPTRLNKWDRTEGYDWDEIHKQVQNSINASCSGNETASSCH
jgi:hypothetical protein